MKIRTMFAAALLIVSCGEPDSKVNADPNNSTNNANNANNVNNTQNNSTNGPGEIVPEDYDQSCTFDDDCVLINAGDPCECHVCADAAISSGSQSAYQADVAAAMCGAVDCPAIGCGEELLPHCNGGTCDIRPAKYVAADDFDRACSVDEDCAAVFEGEVCAPCQSCKNSAINTADLEAYEAQFDVSCAPAGVDCACAEPTVSCNEGRCELSF